MSGRRGAEGGHVFLNKMDAVIVPSHLEGVTMFICTYTLLCIFLVFFLFSRYCCQSFLRAFAFHFCMFLVFSNSASKCCELKRILRPCTGVLLLHCFRLLNKYGKFFVPRVQLENVRSVAWSQFLELVERETPRKITKCN